MHHYLLHIDTSADSAVVALNYDGKIQISRTNNEARNHAASVNLLIEAVMSEANISFTDLSALVVCGGPGSYTGLRIGLATAKGLCYATDKPLILDNKLALLSYQSFCEYGALYDQYVTLMIARNKEYFIAIYDNNFKCSFEPQHIMEEALSDILDSSKKTFLTTDADTPEIGTAEGGTFVVEKEMKISMEHWAKYAFDQIKCHDIEILSTSEPFYLKQVYTHK